VHVVVNPTGEMICIVRCVNMQGELCHSGGARWAGKSDFVNECTVAMVRFEGDSPPTIFLLNILTGTQSEAETRIVGFAVGTVSCFLPTTLWPMELPRYLLRVDPPLILYPRDKETAVIMFLLLTMTQWEIVIIRSCVYMASSWTVSYSCKVCIHSFALVLKYVYY
jgi:hypothetical protein